MNAAVSMLRASMGGGRHFYCAFGAGLVLPALVLPLVGCSVSDDPNMWYNKTVVENLSGHSDAPPSAPPAYSAGAPAPPAVASAAPNSPLAGTAAGTQRRPTQRALLPPQRRRYYPKANSIVRKQAVAA